MADSRTKAENFLRHLEPLRGALESYCRRSLHDPGAIADVLQSAVASCYRDFHLYAEGTNFRAWIFRYVHLEIRNWNRKSARARHEELPADLGVEDGGPLGSDEPLFQALLDDPEAVLDHCDADLALAVRGLSPLERSALLLQAVGGFKYREIADILEVPVGTVMSGLARGRLRLRQRLVKYGIERGLLKAEESDP